jgi:hypothetical protein
MARQYPDEPTASLDRQSARICSAPGAAFNYCESLRKTGAAGLLYCFAAGSQLSDGWDEFQELAHELAIGPPRS